MNTLASESLQLDVHEQVEAFPEVDLRHSCLSSWLSAVLRLFVDTHDLGTVLATPYLMKASAELPPRSPDLMFVCKTHQDRLQPACLQGPADLCVEVVSPGSQVCDRGEKFYEYEQAGVREYWLLDPIRRKAEFYTLGDDGLYQPQAISGGIFHSAVLPGFWLRDEWLWDQPKVNEVARELSLF